MRVIAGSARGRRLKSLPGLDTRPTTDKVKESMFNILQFELEGRRVLDLFAGSGQLGLEALSRGAKHCTFVEQARPAAGIIRENVALCGFQDRCRVVQGEALSFLAGCGEKFDLLLLDPPYRAELMDRAVELAAKVDILREDGIMVCETMARRVLPALPDPYQWGREYRYGQIKLTVCRRAASEDKQ